MLSGTHRTSEGKETDMERPRKLRVVRRQSGASWRGGRGGPGDPQGRVLTLNHTGPNSLMGTRGTGWEGDRAGGDQVCPSPQMLLSRSPGLTRRALGSAQSSGLRAPGRGPRGHGPAQGSLQLGV